MVTKAARKTVKVKSLRARKVSTKQAKLVKGGKPVARYYLENAWPRK